MSYRKRIEEKVIDIPPEPKQKQQNVHNVKPTLDDTKMTRQELRSILKAMDHDGFDNIMNDYIKEISNPDNVKETNQYFKEMQEKKDVPANVKLVVPTVGFCIKTKKIYKNLSQKVYINVCSFDGVQKPFANNDNYWNVPFLLNKQRNDQDEKGNHVLVFDVVFHSDALKKSEEEIRFKKLLCDSAVNGINDKLLKEKNERISSDYKIMTKINYKGKEVSYINIHSLDKSEFANKMLPSENYKTEVQKEIDQIKGKFEEIKEEEEEKEFDKIDVEKPNEFIDKTNNTSNEISIQQPKYSFKYTDEVELHNYFYDPNNHGVKPYSKLSIEIQAPLMEGLDKHLILDISSKLLVFKYKEIYELNLNLPCEIDIDKCSAKFDKAKKILRVICSILKKPIDSKFIKHDPDIEEVYEENNKIVEKNSKIQEVNNQKEGMGDQRISNNEVDTKKLQNNEDISSQNPMNTSEKINENREDKPIEQQLEKKENPKEVLEIKEPSKNENDLKLSESTTEKSDEKVKIEEIKNETDSEQKSESNIVKEDEKRNEIPQDSEKTISKEKKRIG